MKRNSKRRTRKSFLQRSEEVVLEHIPDKYQKSVVGVYRLGFFVNIVGIICSIITVLMIISLFTIERDILSASTLISRIVLLTLFVGLAIIGTCYTKMKMNPPLALGWGIILGLISLILTIFFGFITFASMATNLNEIYGTATMLIIQSFTAGFMILSLVVLLNVAYYLFFAHKGYTEWYEGYARRRHLDKTTELRRHNTHNEDNYTDEDI